LVGVGRPVAPHCDFGAGSTARYDASRKLLFGSRMQIEQEANALRSRDVGMDAAHPKAARVSLDGPCRCVLYRVRCVERCSNAVPLLIWTHCLNYAAGAFPVCRANDPRCSVCVTGDDADQASAAVLSMISTSMRKRRPATAISFEQAARLGVPTAEQFLETLPPARSQITTPCSSLQGAVIVSIQSPVGEPRMKRQLDADQEASEGPIIKAEERPQ
jgi:hypothetical protein